MSAPDGSKTYQLFKAGTSREGWFTNQHLVDQFNGCIEVLRYHHPNCELTIAFDNSMTHRARAPDGLDANRLNKSDGGKNVPLMRPGWYLEGNVRVEQIMRNEKGEQLGLVSILKRRGHKHLNDGGHELNKICYDCKHGASKELRLEQANYSEKCCLTYVLNNEPDFQAQKEWLTEVVENSHCKIIFYPKYHCELNFIEMVWGWLKSYHRRSCTYTFKHLETNLPISLETKLPLSFVRRASQHCFRFMQGYRHGLYGSVLEYAVKKYTSHRAIPSNVFKTIEADYEETRKLKAEARKK